MKALILAAGRGSRMGHLTGDQPKGMVKLHGRSLIEGQIAALSAAGIDDIGLVTGYCAEALAPFGRPTFHNPDWARSNMLHSLRHARDWLSGDTCIVSYSDIFYSPQPVQALKTLDAPIGIAYDPQWLQLWQRRFARPLDDAETFRLDAEGRVIEIGNKTDEISNIQGQYMGLLRFTPAGWQQVENLLAGLPQARQLTLDMTSLLALLIREGITVRAVANLDPWGEVDSESDLLLYEGSR